MLIHRIKRLVYAVIVCVVLWTIVAIFFIQGRHNVQETFHETPKAPPPPKELAPKKPQLITVNEVAQYDPEINSILKEASRWFGKADPVAQNYIGWVYQNGKHGVSKDESAAALWYQRAAKNGNAEAQNSLGLFYEQGRGGLQRDTARAAVLYRVAAESGNQYAAKNLDRMFKHRRGGLQVNKAKASPLIDPSEQHRVDNTEYYIPPYR